MQANDSKVVENAKLSFTVFENIIKSKPISNNLTEIMMKYRSKDKMEMI